MVNENAEAALSVGTATVRPVVGTNDAGARPELSDLEREILVFERQWWKYAGAKEGAVLEQFGMTATRYFQVVNALLDHPAALAYDAQLVGRLRRLRDARRLRRSTR